MLPRIGLISGSLTADAVVLAYRFATLLGGFYDTLHARLHERVLLLGYLQVHYVAGHAVGDEYHHVVYAGKCFAFGSDAGDGYVF